ncbi:hypothetical protein TPE_1541 [Treponema pedis str. T A4]|uniref:Uncharacterized protein n=1 Tax=Treponema pedis str. T A4 TaxID=1291379 RepID=S6A426_9SPIR|nr:hypothetical protein TPE_1541 [Treponema pedis str. T A4]
MKALFLKHNPVTPIKKVLRPFAFRPYTYLPVYPFIPALIASVSNDFYPSL